MAQQASIRPVTDLADFAQVETLQQQVWHFASGAEIVPAHLLKGVADNGGLLLSAFDLHGVMVGFVFGFLACQGGRIKHHSHMMGILPEYQDCGLGFRLKCAQRQAVLRQDLDWVTWTYDPLEGRNAHLNIGKLGVVCTSYVEDMYGELRDSFNAGIPTDRFQVDWWLCDQRVERRMRGDRVRLTAADALAQGAVRVNQTYSADGLRLPAESDLQSCSNTMLIEIPGEFQAIKSANDEAARSWRLHTRELFIAYFDAGYAVIDFISDTTAGERRNYYVLEREGQLPSA